MAAKKPRLTLVRLSRGGLLGYRGVFAIRSEDESSITLYTVDRVQGSPFLGKCVTIRKGSHKVTRMQRRTIRRYGLEAVLR